MRINIDLDDALLKEAFRWTGLQTKKELVHLALQELIANRQRRDVRELRGRDGICTSYDHKKLRQEEI